MAGLAIDNLKDNPERFLLLKQKIKKKDDFTLTNKKKVVLDYRDSTIKTIFLADDFDTISDKIKYINKNKYLAIKQLGYDEYYILPGGNALKTENETLGDELVGAGKAKLKSAFGKMSKGKLASRQLLNKFVGMVA